MKVFIQLYTKYKIKNINNFFYNHEINSQKDQFFLKLKNKPNNKLFSSKSLVYINNIYLKKTILLVVSKNNSNFLFFKDLSFFKSKIIGPKNFFENFNHTFFYNNVYVPGKSIYKYIYTYTYYNTFFRSFFLKNINKTRIKTRFSFYTKVKIKVDLFSKKLNFSSLIKGNTDYKYKTSQEKKFLVKISNVHLSKVSVDNYKLVDIYLPKKCINDDFIVFEKLKKVFYKPKLVLLIQLTSIVIFIKRNKKVMISNRKTKTKYMHKLFLHHFIHNAFNNTNYIPETLSIKDFAVKYNNYQITQPVNKYNYIHSNKLAYNNFMPYCNFFLKSEFLKMVIIRNISTPKYLSYYNVYLKSFLEKLSKKKVWIKINTDSSFVMTSKVKNYLTSLYDKYKFEYSGFSKHFYLLEFFEIIYLTFYYRDLKFFSYWVKELMEKIHLKKHKRLLKIFHFLLRNNTELFDLTEINGFMMDVRGKLSVTGNAKKRHYIFNVGSIGNTSKNHDLCFNQTTVRTSTGVLGVTMSLSH